ncbi:hypothetical protein E5983_07955 [Streptococcus danieliae]|uniref:Uncharacterized protein n=1 Tax=Streptococcus danieliae TaxID=747656 RepID=A0A7X3KCS1_9STRE|nr:hypothetical protein [Streptococcus danieliae]MVX59559.1 hypothetical protein [Streptococcus danieliae]
MLYFPGISEADFDETAPWLVVKTDDLDRMVLFAGQGGNSGLELELNFQEDVEQFKTFVLGELIQLPPTLFRDPEEMDDSMEYESF